MKKIFTLFVAFLTLAFCAKAQVTIILEAHDVWGDGSGYQLLLDADHTAYGTVIPTTGGLTTSGDASASVYAEFEYKIPVNADGSLTTTNIVYDGADTITIPAGTYDFCVTNPTPGDRMWIAGEGRADDYVFADGDTYHFSVAMNGSGDQVTILHVPTVPTIMPNVTSLDFGSVAVGTTKEETVTLTNFLLTTTVTATTTAPYSISSDGTNFGTSATIPVAGGDLYVRYAPTTVGTHNGTVTLSSTGAANVTIDLTGAAIDCNNSSIPYHTDFDIDIACWTVIDANDDGKTFVLSPESGFAYYMYSATNDADDWLISPTFNFNGSYHGSVDYAAYSSYYPERFQLFLINSSNNMTALTGEIDVTEEEFLTQGFNLPSLNGSYRIGIHAISDADAYALLFNNFNIMNGVSVEEFTNEAIIFPNPANNVLNINANSNISRVEVFNMMGQMICSYIANDVNTQINTANFANGVYMVKINTENGTLTKKFTVAR